MLRILFSMEMGIKVQSKCNLGQVVFVEQTVIFRTKSQFWRHKRTKITLIPKIYCLYVF